MGAIGSIVGGVMQANAAKEAGSIQAAAATKAAELEQQQYQTTRADLAPYNTTGQSVLPALTSYEPAAQNALTGAYNTAQGAIPSNINSADLLNGPGGQAYAFNLNQGIKQIQNSQTFKGLGNSGAAIKAGVNYATGLADKYYNDYFTNAQSIYGDQNQQFANMVSQTGQGFNQLYAPATLGESAASNTGNIGATLATQAGNNIAAAGQASGAGVATAGKALGTGIQQALQQMQQNLLLYGMG